MVRCMDILHCNIPPNRSIGRVMGCVLDLVRGVMGNIKGGDVEKGWGRTRSSLRPIICIRLACSKLVVLLALAASRVGMPPTLSGFTFNRTIQHAQSDPSILVSELDDQKGNPIIM